MADTKKVPSLAYMATNPKERINTSRALANIGDRHELIIKALQEGYSCRDVSESLKQHDGIDVAPETIRRHYGQHVQRGKKRKRKGASTNSPAPHSTPQPPPQQPPPTIPPKPSPAGTNAFDRVGRRP